MKNNFKDQCWICSRWLYKGHVAQLVRTIHKISRYRGQATIRKSFRGFEKMNCKQALISTVEPHGFFGELALLDEEKRVGTAIAKTNCSLIFIEKNVFNRIADDVPDVLRQIVNIILGYLRKNLAMHSSSDAKVL